VRSATAIASGSLSISSNRPPWAQLFEHAAAMAAATERAIEIPSRPAHAQPFHDLRVQDRKVGGPGIRATAGHNCSRAARRQVGIREGLPDLRQVRLLAPQFELVAHAQQHGLLLDAHRVAMAGRQRDAAAAVGLDEGGRADQLQLQVAADALGARQGVDLVAHALPDRMRVEVEATGVERVVGDDQLVAALARDLVPVAGRNRQPALVVDRDGGLTLEHRPARFRPSAAGSWWRGKPRISRFSHESPR
jgi:hypothetical protein